MKNMKKTLAAGIVAGMLLFAGCSKDGATGPAGATGPQGTTGTNGTNGTNGSANVSTYNLTQAPNQWTSDGYGGWKALFTATGFNPTVGAVEAFFSADNTNWYAMPFTFSTNETVAYSFNSAGLTVNDIAIGTTAIPAWTTTCYFKFVVIPPAHRMANPNLNLKNWAEVSAAFNLK
ncbi:MAG TPA: hypothetical protein VF411_11400 [Bacteroidia bacterium]